MNDLDLARQLRDYVDATTEPVGPARTTGAIGSYTINGRSAAPNDMEIVMLTPNDTQDRPTTTRRLALVAAAIAVLVGGLVVAVTVGGENDDSSPADAPESVLPPYVPPTGEPAQQPEAEALPVETSVDLDAARYTTDTFGMDVAFTTQQPMRLEFIRPGEVLMVDWDADGGLVSQILISRWAGWSTPSEATLETPAGSIDPLEPDAWAEANDLSIVASTDTEIDGRPARVFDVTIDDTPTSTAPGCARPLPGCFGTGEVAGPRRGFRLDWVAAGWNLRYYLITIEGSSPLLISAVGDSDDFYTGVDRMVATIEIGPDAPAIAER